MSKEHDIDVSELPTHGFGSRMPTAWGTLGFIVLEATGFALAIGTYLYLQTLNREWPLGAPPPDLLFGTLFTIILLLSELPNIWLKRTAKEESLSKVRIGLTFMSLVGIVLLVIRAFEFPALNINWDTNAYGSIVWFLLGLHTVHLLTDVGDTLVLNVLMFTKHAKVGKRFADTEDNSIYWDFVVISWLPIYMLLYWVPRW